MYKLIFKKVAKLDELSPAKESLRTRKHGPTADGKFRLCTKPHDDPEIKITIE
jgi:hypothetical protein